MAAKTANILARVAPDVKAEAENIMSALGVPASVVINMLYKQIIMQRRIPFDLSLPVRPRARDEMSATEFDSLIETGLRQAKAGQSRPMDACMSDIKTSIRTWG